MFLCLCLFRYFLLDNGFILRLIFFVFVLFDSQSGLKLVYLASASGVCMRKILRCTATVSSSRDI